MWIIYKMKPTGIIVWSHSLQQMKCPSDVEDHVLSSLEFLEKRIRLKEIEKI